MRDAAIAITMFVGLLYGSFWIGRMKERHDYVGGFIKQVEAAYWQGYEDARQKDRFTNQERSAPSVAVE